MLWRLAGSRFNHKTLRGRSSEGRRARRPNAQIRLGAVGQVGLPDDGGRRHLTLGDMLGERSRLAGSRPPTRTHATSPALLGGGGPCKGRSRLRTASLQRPVERRQRRLLAIEALSSDLLSEVISAYGECCAAPVDVQFRPHSYQSPVRCSRAAGAAKASVPSGRRTATAPALRKCTWSWECWLR